MHPLALTLALSFSTNALAGDAPSPAGAGHALVVTRTPAGATPQETASFAGADTTSVARLADGRIALAFQGFPADDPRAFNRTAVRFSGDEGRTWTDPQPIEIAGLDATLAPPFDPTLVALPDGRVRLYFISFDERGLAPGTPPTATGVYSAISDDGRRYAFEPGTRFSIEGRVVLDAAAARHDGVFHLVIPDHGTAAEFLGRRKSGEAQPGGNGYHAVSKDGLAFERAPDLPLPSTRNLWWGNLLSEGDTLRFFGTGPGPWPLVSRDGRTWKPATEPLAMPGVDPAAVRLRDGTLLLTATREPEGPQPGPSVAPPQSRPSADSRE
jgi:hypothetical protein